MDYAKKIHSSSDAVAVILRREDVEPFVNAGLPEEYIIEDTIDDPWIRDVSPVIPSKSIQFKYIGGGTKEEAQYTQSVYNSFISKYNVRIKKVDYYLDGGNVVDNNLDKAIITDKFLRDNGLTRTQAVAVLKTALEIPTVIIVPADEPKLGHSDGMVSFPCRNTIFVSTYDEPFRSQVLTELKQGCQDCNIIEVPTFEDNSTYKGGYASSCGVYVNSVVTGSTIFVPQFNRANDSEVVRLYEKYSCGKVIVPVDATAVCKMGGSLRCLSWQVEGQNFDSASSYLQIVHPAYFIITAALYFIL